MALILSVMPGRSWIVVALAYMARLLTFPQRVNRSGLPPLSPSMMRDR
jgi:hypothetical protein